MNINRNNVSNIFGGIVFGDAYKQACNRFSIVVVDQVWYGVAVPVNDTVCWQFREKILDQLDEKYK